jgi:hypothetical protein
MGATASVSLVPHKRELQSHECVPLTRSQPRLQHPSFFHTSSYDAVRAGHMEMLVVPPPFHLLELTLATCALAYSGAERRNMWDFHATVMGRRTVTD